MVAVLGRWTAGRFHQPSVLGELLAGVVLGNVGYWLGLPLFRLVMHMGDAGAIYEAVWSTGLSVREAAATVFDAAQLAPGGTAAELVELMTHGPVLIDMVMGLAIFSNLGVIILLFLVGLESSVQEMKKVGGAALLVAVVGVVAPFGLGYGVTLWLEPEQSTTALVALHSQARYFSA